MANLITLSRFPVLIVVLLLVYSQNVAARWAAVVLTFLLIILDTIDGVVARALHQTSRLGSVLDIAADRAVEIVLWVCFSHLGLIPLAIPIIVIIRGTLVDALRTGNAGDTKTPFGLTSSKWGKRIVASSFMRSSYGVVKAVAFCGLAIVRALQLYPAGTPGGSLLAGFHLAANIVSWVAVALCIIRAIPVLVEVPAYIQEAQQ